MASSSSCHDTKINHDVFISFRGKNVRESLLSHLKRVLGHKGIDFYVDERLDKGDEISSSLLRAIERSQISLVIFSEHYASSKWCLEELAKIIECMERNKQVVIPVFYHVHPSVVRYQLEDYGDALAKHEEKFQENMLKVQSWRSALKKAADLSGFHYPTNIYEDEADLVDKIVKDIWKKLSKFSLSKSNGLVGIDQNIAHIQSLLQMESSEVLFVGIWGMGGIGKTTLAREIFHKYSAQYDGCCFLLVREKVEQPELSSLQEKFISELFEGEGLHTSGTRKEKFLDSAKRRMDRKKVLVVLDDVNTSEQLNFLVGKDIFFGAGSRVIITSRYKHVLTSGGVHQIHEVREMDPQDSLKLFCLNAFNETKPKMGYEKLTGKVVKIARGNPLALTVLGADFHSRSTIKTWECALSKIKKYSHPKIQKVLRFSYDGLDEVEQKAFVEIAFFFQDDDKDYVIGLLDAWGFHGASGIEVLQQKALITISNDNRIQMHDLIRQMGWEIVREESKEYPGRRSRLRDSEDVYEVFRSNLGNEAVEAMQIDMSRITDLHLKANTLKKMPRLRFLKFYKSQHGFSDSPNRPLQENPIWSQLNTLFLSASEIHVKFLDHYHLINGCSADPSRLNEQAPRERSTMYNIERPGEAMTHAGVEVIMNSSFVRPSNLEIECSGVDVEQLKNLPDEQLCMRCTHYIKFSMSSGHDTGKPKFHILHDNGLRYCKRASYEPELYDSVDPDREKNLAEMFLSLEKARMKIKGYSPIFHSRKTRLAIITFLLLCLLITSIFYHYYPTLSSPISALLFLLLFQCSPTPVISGFFFLLLFLHSLYFRRYFFF